MLEEQTLAASPDTLRDLQKAAKQATRTMSNVMVRPTGPCAADPHGLSTSTPEDARDCLQVEDRSGWSKQKPVHLARYVGNSDESSFRLKALELIKF